MDHREKLVDIVCDATQINGCIHSCNHPPCAMVRGIVDALIQNGVTVQEEAKLYWKPVKPGEWNLTCSACDSHLGCKENANFCPECGAKFVYPKAVAHQPPKGE